MELERIEFIIACVAPEPDYKASNSRRKKNSSLQWAVNFINMFLYFIIQRLCWGVTFSGQVSVFR